MDFDYTSQKLYEAVSSLASDTRPLKDRLAGAYLSYQVLTIDDFPDDLKADFEKVDALNNLANSIPGNPAGGTIKAALAAMSEKEVKAIIDTLAMLHHAVTRRR